MRSTMSFFTSILSFCFSVSTHALASDSFLKNLDTEARGKGCFQDGVYYLVGAYGYDENREEAEKLINQAATFNNREAKICCAFLSQRAELRSYAAQEFYGEEQYLLSLALFHSLAMEGIAPAAYNVSMMFLSSQGVNKDLVKAFQWCKKAADAGLCQAQLKLGEMYYHGWGSAQSDAKAYELFEKVSQSPNPGPDRSKAQMYLASMHDEGRHGSMDPLKAFHFYTQAAQNGCPAAQYKVGKCYIEGHGTVENQEIGLHWLRQAAYGKDPNAIGTLRTFGINVDASQQAHDYGKGISTMEELFNS